jgi:hypothetical protein
LPCPICRADLLQSKKIRIIDSRVDEDVADNENVDDDSDDSDDDSDDENNDLYFWESQGEEDYDEFPSVRQNTIVDLT